MNQFKWWYQVKESFNDSFEQPTDPLKNLEWKELKLDGGGLFNTKNKKNDFIESEDLVDPSLEIQEEQIQEEYHNNLPDYSDTWIEEEYKEKLNNEKIKKTNEYPLIKNYLEEKNISIDNLALNKDWKIDINAIDWLSINDKEMLNWLLVNLEWENKMQNIIKLGEIINDIPEFDDFNKEMWDNWFDDWVLNIIWGNYIDIPWKDWNIDKQKNLSVAIKIWKNKILNKVKNIKVDTQTYKTAIANIDSWNFKKQLEWINSLYYLAFSSEWKLWAKDSLKLHKDKRKKEIINNANILEQKIQKALKSNDTEKIKILNKQKDNIIKEAEELNTWDIFKSWEIDTISDSEPKQKETN